MQLSSEVMQRCGVRVAYLFGSRARGQECEGSDLDLAFWFAESTTALERLDQITALESALRVQSEVPLDLISLNDASPALAYEAVIRGQNLYRESFEAMFELEQRVRGRYEDLVASQRFFTSARRERMGLTG